jgi:flagellar protein FlaG
MADEAISTAILTVATIIAALVLVNAMYPALYSASGSILSMNDRSSDRLRTEMTVLTEWCPAGRPDDIGLQVWVKNTGSRAISAADMAEADAFLYTGNGSGTRLPRSAPPDSWSYTILSGNGDATWDPAETIMITVHYDTPGGLSPGTLRFRLVLPNGVYAEDEFAYS